LPKKRAIAIILIVAMEIIRPSLLFPVPRSASVALVALTTIALANHSSAAELVLQKVPPLTVEQAPAYPENLARYPLGAQVEITPKADPAAEAALLAGDPTAGYNLPNGATTVLVSLGKIENIDSVSFLNQGAKGHVSIATSKAKLPADSPQWNSIAEQDLTGDALKVKVGPSEAKYLKLTFNVNEAGRIADLGIYSTPTVAAFTMPRTRKDEKSERIAMVSYNVTDLHARARAVYVSSGEDVKQANNMIDDQPGTVYNFAPPDAAPTAVVDLGKATKLRRISALYSPGRGTLDFYVLQSLPGGPQTASAKSLQLDEAAIAGMQRVGSITDDGSGRAAVDFPETTGRYILLKWTPAEPGSAFSVAEIAAFGNERRENLVAANSPTEGSETTAGDGKTVLDGKDFKDMPEEGPPAEGPASELPQPPPFVFAPVVSPASP
jgi:hypothetical protein